MKSEVISTPSYNKTNDSNDPWQDLASAIVIEAVNDYIRLTKRANRLASKVENEPDAERKTEWEIRLSVVKYEKLLVVGFLKSQWCYELCELDGDVLIAGIERNIRNGTAKKAPVISVKE